MRADPTYPADDPGSTGPSVLGAVVVAPPWKPLDEPRRVEIVGHTPRVLMQGRKKSRRQTPTRIPL
jgi:hypothetical protein